MEVLFHFLFTIIKIIVLASIYASVLLFLLERIGKSEPKSWLQNISEHKKILRFGLTLSISVLLFIWFFSHWGNHGLGDNARIPLRNGYAITTINANKYAAIDNVVVGKGKSLETTKFMITDNIVMGNLKSWFYSYRNNYFIFNTKTKQLTEFRSFADLKEFTLENNFPQPNRLKTFDVNYSIYWHIWRFWLLP